MLINEEIVTINITFRQKDSLTVRTWRMPSLEHIVIDSLISMMIIRLIIITYMNVIEKGIKTNQKYNDAEQYAKKL